MITSVAVSAADLARVEPSAFAAAVLAGISEQVQTAGAGRSAEVVVVVAEESELEMDTGNFQVYDAAGNLNPAVADAFLGRVQAAVCVNTTGACSAVLADRRRHRRLTDGGIDESSQERRRLKRAAKVRVSRSFHASAPSRDASSLVASNMAADGVGVTSSRLTALSATSTVTTTSAVAGSGAITAALSGSALSTTLATHLPSVSLDVSEPLVITPPAAPPAGPPILELSSWPALPPSANGGGSANPAIVGTISEELILTFVLCGLILLPALAIWYAAIKRIQRSRQDPKGGGGGGGGDEPGMAASGATSEDPVQLMFNMHPGGGRGAGGSEPSEDPPLQLTFTRRAGRSPPSSDAFTETGRVSSPLPPELMAKTPRVLSQTRPAVLMAETSTTMQEEVAAYSAIHEAREGGWTSSRIPAPDLRSDGRARGEPHELPRFEPPRRRGAPSLMPTRLVGAPPVLPPAQHERRAPEGPATSSKRAVTSFSDARAPPELQET